MSSKIEITIRNQEQIILRANAADKKTSAALKAASLKLPKQRRKEGGAHWFSPDEFLLFVDDAKSAIEAIKPKLPAKSLIHDATGARVVITLKGPHLRDVFAKGAPRDLLKVEVGEVVRTRLGQVAVAFWLNSESEAELVCFRSVAGFVEEWLKMASRPDGLPVLSH